MSKVTAGADSSSRADDSKLKGKKKRNQHAKKENSDQDENKNSNQILSLSDKPISSEETLIDNMNMAELRDRAKSLGITTNAKISKTDLAEKLKRRLKGDDDAQLESSDANSVDDSVSTATGRSVLEAEDGNSNSAFPKGNRKSVGAKMSRERSNLGWSLIENSKAVSKDVKERELRSGKKLKSASPRKSTSSVSTMSPSGSVTSKQTSPSMSWEQGSVGETSQEQNRTLRSRGATPSLDNAKPRVDGASKSVVRKPKIFAESPKVSPEGQRSRDVSVDRQARINSQSARKTAASSVASVGKKGAKIRAASTGAAAEPHEGDQADSTASSSVPLKRARAGQSKSSSPVSLAEESAQKRQRPKGDTEGDPGLGGGADRQQEKHDERDFDTDIDVHALGVGTGLGDLGSMNVERAVESFSSPVSRAEIDSDASALLLASSHIKFPSVTFSSEDADALDALRGSNGIGEGMEDGMDLLRPLQGGNGDGDFDEEAMDQQHMSQPGDGEREYGEAEVGHGHGHEDEEDYDSNADTEKNGPGDTTRLQDADEEVEEGDEEEEEGAEEGRGESIGMAGADTDADQYKGNGMDQSDEEEEDDEEDDDGDDEEDDDEEDDGDYSDDAEARSSGRVLGGHDMPGANEEEEEDAGDDDEDDDDEDDDDGADEDMDDNDDEGEGGSGDDDDGDDDESALTGRQEEGREEEESGDDAESPQGYFSPMSPPPVAARTAANLVLNDASSKAAGGANEVIDLCLSSDDGSDGDAKISEAAKSPQKLARLPNQPAPELASVPLQVGVDDGAMTEAGVDSAAAAALISVSAGVSTPPPPHGTATLAGRRESTSPSSTTSSAKESSSSAKKRLHEMRDCRLTDEPLPRLANLSGSKVGSRVTSPQEKARATADVGKDAVALETASSTFATFTKVATTTGEDHPILASDFAAPSSSVPAGMLQRPVTSTAAAAAAAADKGAGSELGTILQSLSAEAYDLFWEAVSNAFPTRLGAILRGQGSATEMRVLARLREQSIRDAAGTAAAAAAGSAPAPTSFTAPVPSFSASSAAFHHASSQPSSQSSLHAPAEAGAERFNGHHDLPHSTSAMLMESGDSEAAFETGGSVEVSGARLPGPFTSSSSSSAAASHLPLPPLPLQAPNGHGPQGRGSVSFGGPEEVEEVEFAEEEQPLSNGGSFSSSAPPGGTRPKAAPASRGKSSNSISNSRLSGDGAEWTREDMAVPSPLAGESYGGFSLHDAVPTMAPLAQAAVNPRHQSVTFNTKSLHALQNGGLDDGADRSNGRPAGGYGGPSAASLLSGDFYTGGATGGVVRNGVAAAHLPAEGAAGLVDGRKRGLEPDVEPEAFDPSMAASSAKRRPQRQSRGSAGHSHSAYSGGSVSIASSISDIVYNSSAGLGHDTSREAYGRRSSEYSHHQSQSFSGHSHARFHLPESRRQTAERQAPFRGYTTGGPSLAKLLVQPSAKPRTLSFMQRRRESEKLRKQQQQQQSGQSFSESASAAESAGSTPWRGPLAGSAGHTPWRPARATDNAPGTAATFHSAFASGTSGPDRSGRDPPMMSVRFADTTTTTSTYDNSYSASGSGSGSRGGAGSSSRAGLGVSFAEDASWVAKPQSASSVVAKRIMETLSNLTTPLDGERKRPVPVFSLERPPGELLELPLSSTASTAARAAFDASATTGAAAAGGAARFTASTAAVNATTPMAGSASGSNTPWKPLSMRPKATPYRQGGASSAGAAAAEDGEFQFEEPVRVQDIPDDLIFSNAAASAAGVGGAGSYRSPASSTAADNIKFAFSPPLRGTRGRQSAPAPKWGPAGSKSPASSPRSPSGSGSGSGSVRKQAAGGALSTSSSSAASPRSAPALAQSQAPAPAPSAAATTVWAQALATQSSMIKCPSCMVQNEKGRSKCVSCESPLSAAGGSTAALGSAPLAATSGGVWAQALATQSSMIKCPSCMVQNEKGRSKCVSCESPLSGGAAAPASAPTSDKVPAATPSWANPDAIKAAAASGAGGAISSGGFVFGTSAPASVASAATGGNTAGPFSLPISSTAAATSSSTAGSNSASAPASFTGFTFGASSSKPSTEAPAPAPAAAPTSGVGFQFGSSAPGAGATTATAAPGGGFGFGAAKAADVATPSADSKSTFGPSGSNAFGTTTTTTTAAAAFPSSTSATAFSGSTFSTAPTFGMATKPATADSASSASSGASSLSGPLSGPFTSSPRGGAFGGTAATVDQQEGAGPKVATFGSTLGQSSGAFGSTLGQGGGAFGMPSFAATATAPASVSTAANGPSVRDDRDGADGGPRKRSGPAFGDFSASATEVAAAAAAAPAAPAASFSTGFAFGTPTSTGTVPSFGQAGASFTLPVPAATLAQPAAGPSGAFSGASNTPAAAAALKPTFAPSFGGAPAPAPVATTAMMSFGNTSFGGTGGAAFGTSQAVATSASASTGTTGTSVPVFSFTGGAAPNPSAPTLATDVPTPSYSPTFATSAPVFGSQGAVTAAAPAASAAPFMFGQQQQQQQQLQPTAFGAATAAAAATPSSQGAPSNFSAGSTTTPTAAAAAASGAPFSFGNPVGAAPTPFVFGAGQAPATAASGLGVPAASAFGGNFGANSATVDGANAATPFVFGAGAPATTNFNFAAAAPTGGAAAPFSFGGVTGGSIGGQDTSRGQSGGNHGSESPGGSMDMGGYASGDCASATTAPGPTMPAFPAFGTTFGGQPSTSVGASGGIAFPSTPQGVGAAAPSASFGGGQSFGQQQMGQAFGSINNTIGSGSGNGSGSALGGIQQQPFTMLLPPANGAVSAVSAVSTAPTGGGTFMFGGAAGGSTAPVAASSFGGAPAGGVISFSGSNNMQPGQGAKAAAGVGAASTSFSLGRTTSQTQQGRKKVVAKRK